MKIVQIILDKEYIRKNKNFLRNIYNSEKIIGGRNFDMLDGTSFRRKADNGMNLERFLSLNWSKRHIRLQIGSPSEDRIVYCANINIEGISRFAWLDIQLNEENFGEISKLFKRSYGSYLK